MANLKTIFKMKSFLPQLILGFSLGMIAFDSSAAVRCESLFATGFAKTQSFKSVRLSISEILEIRQAIVPYKVDHFFSQADLVQKLAKQIEANTEKTGVEHAEELAVVGTRIQNVLEKRMKENLAPHLVAATKSILTKARYNVAEQIARLEAYKANEFTLTDSHPAQRNGYTLISLAEYPEFAMALAQKTATPKAAGSGSILSFSDYRDIVSNNLWLYTLDEHDLKHMHFAHSHPMAAASLFRLTRSKNFIRYFLIAIMFEGVDTVQYDFERRIASHFKQKGYSLEEAMVYIASATKEQMLEIGTAIGVNFEYDSKVLQVKNWQPRTWENGPKPEQFEKDIQNFFEKSVTDLGRLELQNLMHKKDSTAPGSDSMPGDEIHHN